MITQKMEEKKKKKPMKNNSFSFMCRIHQYLIWTRLICPKWKITDEKRPLGAASDGAAMDEHFFERDREGGVVAVDDHGSGVTHEANIDAGQVEMDRRRVVVGGDHGEGLAPPVLLPQVVQCHSLVRVLRLRSAVYSVFRQVAQPFEVGV